MYDTGRILFDRKFIFRVLYLPIFVHMDQFKDWLQERLKQPLPGFEAQKKMMNLNRPRTAGVPENARESGVLILLYPDHGAINTVLIERTKDGGVHSGQIALPGGRREPSDRDIIATALREANEEVALEAGMVTVLGNLTDLYIPVSNFIVQPVIAYSGNRPVLSASDNEVADIIHISLEQLFSNKEEVDVIASGTVSFKVHTLAYMLTPPAVLWGATAMILSELESIWNEYKSRPE